MNDKATMMLYVWGEKLPSNAIFLLKERIAKLPEDKLSYLNYLSFLQLKDPLVGLVLGVVAGAFGADRFYKGDFALGVAKLFLWWITLGIWIIADLFLVWNGIKEDNLKNISNQLTMLGA